MVETTSVTEAIFKSGYVFYGVDNRDKQITMFPFQASGKSERWLADVFRSFTPFVCKCFSLLLPGSHCSLLPYTRLAEETLRRPSNGYLEHCKTTQIIASSGKPIACRTNVNFWRFSGERREARGERRTRVTRDGRSALLTLRARLVLTSARLRNAKTYNACSAG